jgi:hypothetical protein
VTPLGAIDRSGDRSLVAKARRLCGGAVGQRTLDETGQRVTEQGFSVPLKAQFALEAGSYLGETVEHLVEDRDAHRDGLIEAHERGKWHERWLAMMTLACIALSLLLGVCAMITAVSVTQTLAVTGRLAELERQVEQLQQRAP